jgi:hypothetical protein
MHRSLFANDTVRWLKAGSPPAQAASPTVTKLKRSSRLSRILMAACLGLLLGACAESTGPVATGANEDRATLNSAVTSRDNRGDVTNLTILPEVSALKVESQSGGKRRSNYAVAF